MTSANFSDSRPNMVSSCFHNVASPPEGHVEPGVLRAELMICSAKFYTIRRETVCLQKADKIANSSKYNALELLLMDNSQDDIENIFVTLDHSSLKSVYEYLPDGSSNYVKDASYNENLTDSLSQLSTQGQDGDKIEKKQKIAACALRDLRLKLEAAVHEIDSAISLLTLVQKSDYFRVENVALQYQPICPLPLNERSSIINICDFRSCFICFLFVLTLYCVSSILRNGHRKLMRTINASSVYESSQNFHLAMLHFRRKWIYRKNGESFLVDLSFDNCGSQGTKVDGHVELFQKKSLKRSDTSDCPIELRISSNLNQKYPTRLITSLSFPSLFPDDNGRYKEVTLVSNCYSHVGRKRPRESVEDYRMRCAQSNYFVRFVSAVL
ncbi:hypothetical protein GJ496_000866 [Pomphorhynchus laevis]|nr:hypothetical protein GJ496_000866 [Pomphorhynchus laevis]